MDTQNKTRHSLYTGTAERHHVNCPGMRNMTNNRPQSVILAGEKRTSADNSAENEALIIRNN